MPGAEEIAQDSRKSSTGCLYAAACEFIACKAANIKQSCNKRMNI